MNLVGKIFIVLIFVMSVLFMGFAVAIYASHTNWKKVVDEPETGLKAQLDREKAKSGELSSARDRLEKERNAQMLALEDAEAKLQTETEILEKQRDDATRDLTTRTQEARTAVATLAEAHNTLKALRDEVDKLRTEIRQEQQEKDNAFSTVVELTDQQHDLAN